MKFIGDQITKVNAKYDRILVLKCCLGVSVALELSTDLVLYV